MTASVTIKGGRKLRRFIFDIEDAARESILFALRDVIRRVILPELRGRLARSHGKAQA